MRSGNSGGNGGALGCGSAGGATGRFRSAAGARLSGFARATSPPRRAGGGGVSAFCVSSGLDSGKKDTEIGSNAGATENGLRHSIGTNVKCNASERARK